MSEGAVSDAPQGDGPVSDKPPSGRHVLRVLNGRLAGTDKTLPANGSVSIGYQFWQDVVIRDPATKGVAIDLVIEPDHRAQITVLSGAATLLGSTVEAGSSGILPPYVPFEIGGIALAWGEPDSERWTEATGLATVAPTPLVAPLSARDHAVTVLERAGDGLGAWLTGWRVAALAGVMALILLALFAMPIVDALGLRGTPLMRVQTALAEAGLGDLRAAPAPAGDGVIVTGVVANEAARVRAIQALRNSGVDGTVTVQTGAELAQAALGVAQLRGLQAVARPLGRKGVELRTTPLMPDDRTKLIQAVRNDVRGIARLELRDDLPPKDDQPLKTVQDATKKVSNVVSGDPSYIQTVDGARYFAGAMMPSGHRLVGIQGNVVVLEKNGRETRLTF